MTRTSLIEGILDDLAKGVPSAREKLVGEVYGDVAARARRRLSGDDEWLRRFMNPSDITQEISLRLWEYLEHLPYYPTTAAQVFKLVNTMVNRLVLDLCGKYQHSRPTSDNLDAQAAPEPGPTTIPAHILDALSDEEHILLYFWLDDLTADQIADELGVDRATVYRKLTDLRVRLADLFDAG